MSILSANEMAGITGWDVSHIRTLLTRYNVPTEKRDGVKVFDSKDLFKYLFFNKVIDPETADIATVSKLTGWNRTFITNRLAELNVTCKKVGRKQIFDSTELFDKIKVRGKQLI